MSNNWYYIGNIESLTENYSEELVNSLIKSQLVVFHGSFAFFVKENDLNEVFQKFFKSVTKELHWDEAQEISDFYQSIYEDDFSEYIDGNLSEFSSFINKNDLFEAVISTINKMDREQFTAMTYEDIVTKEAKRAIVRSLKNKIQEFENDLATI